MKKIIVCAVLLAALAGGIFGGLALLKPHARPSGANAAFDAILQDIATITVVPHTAGSPENQAVRDMIVARADGLGLTAQVLPFPMDVARNISGYTDAYDNASDSSREWLAGEERGGG